MICCFAVLVPAIVVHWGHRHICGCVQDILLYFLIIVYITIVHYLVLEYNFLSTHIVDNLTPDSQCVVACICEPLWSKNY